MAARVAVAIVLVVALGGMPPVGATAQDDAGLGGDAPDTYDTAATLAEGTYAGWLDPAADDLYDWYRFSSCGGMRLTFQASGGSVTVRVHTTPQGVLGLRTSHGDAVTMQFTYEGPLTFAFYPPTATTARGYSFTIQRLQDDAATGCDAPDSFADAATLPLGAYQGALFYGIGDGEDWYRFEVPACSVARLKFHVADGRAWAHVFSDSGTALYGRSGGGDIHITGGTFRVRFGGFAEGHALYAFAADVAAQPPGPACPRLPAFATAPPL